MDQLPAGSLTNASRSDYAHGSYFVEIPGSVPIGNVFSPIFWAHHARLLKKFDLIRIRSEEGSYDFTLSVEEVRIGGVRVLPWPRLPQVEGRVEDVAAESVKVKAYGDDPAPRIEYRKATKWRVIGIDNNEHSGGYETKTAAATAMIKYMVELGFAPEQVNEHIHNLGLASLMDAA